MIKIEEGGAYKYLWRYGELSALDAAIRRDTDWVQEKLRGLPTEWYGCIFGEWQRHWSAQDGEKRRFANTRLREMVDMLMDAVGCGLQPDAKDDEVKTRAAGLARHFGQVLRHLSDAEAVQRARDLLARMGMLALLPKKKTSDAALVLRLKCELFWRRLLRAMLAKSVEGCAIELGLVHAKGQKYVSGQSVERRKRQLLNAQAALENAELENEYGQRMNVAELVGKSSGSKAIRHAELMVRISGFDAIAEYMGHGACMVTVTCPSRMHKFSDLRQLGVVVENKNYDGTLPNEAQTYLTGQWAKARAALARRGVRIYGFRVAEPHHDGCPHWHMLFFYESQEAGEVLQKTMLRYFLENDSPTEGGAAKHRVKFEQIDRAKGSAVAYVAKYISKSVMGVGLTEDLLGMPILESVPRVEAWAATWRIRQFQQIGGPPVGVWRELRRLNAEQVLAEGDALPQPLLQAVRGANAKQVDMPAALGYAAYVNAQGGAFAARAAMPIILLKQETGELNRYKEVKGPDVIGVQAHGVRMCKRHKNQAAPLPVRQVAKIESERCQWFQVVKGSLPRRVSARPWTRVNNCTLTEAGDWRVGEGVRDVDYIVRSKTGRFFGAGREKPEQKNE